MTLNRTTLFIGAGGNAILALVFNPLPNSVAFMSASIVLMWIGLAIEPKPKP